MQVLPTRPTFHVAIAGAGFIALGVAARLPPVAGFGGALLLAVALGRGLALCAVARLRAEGFELSWEGEARVKRVAVGSSVVLEARLRNASGVAVHAAGIRPIASTMLSVSIEPDGVLLEPGTQRRILLRILPLRVGCWGLHGLSLEARTQAFGGDAFFEVPLVFAHPFGFEALPSSLLSFLQSPRGGRARRSSEIGRPARSAGTSDELRELRDHVVGDPFKKIAWKASARRGRLVVRETEREERDVVVLVLETSVELWAGTAGSAPLDRAIDEIASAATRHLRLGNRVGLVVFASRVSSWIPPAGGAAHGATLARALASASSAMDADRSELDEAAVARRVFDHARPLEPGGLPPAARVDLDVLAARAATLLPRAPFAPPSPFAHTPRETALRRYLSAFGIESPPRMEGEDEWARATLGHVLGRLATETDRPTIVKVWARASEREQSVAKALLSMRARRIELRWSVPRLDAGVGEAGDRRSSIADVTDDAVRIRARASRKRAETWLRRMGVRIEGRA